MTEDSYDIQRINFLILEDNPNMRTLVRAILHALGAHFIGEAADVIAAFEQMKTRPVDIVICDWELERRSGLEFVKALRTSEKSPNRFVPIIMLTAHSEIERVTEARDCGVNEFVVKPISAHTLYTRIREVIRNPRSFVETKDYFGPDRRRRQVKYNGEERRKDAPTANLTEAEVKALMDK